MKTTTSGTSPDPEDKRETSSGIPIAAVYPVGDGERPGEHPFTRGIHPRMYRDRLWTHRQYAGFGNAEETNRRFRYLLSQGQNGLSVAFDLPTQIGYDSDDPIARGEVGKVGVPISTVEDMETLLTDIPLDAVSVSMTINSTAPILLAFMVVVARRRGVPPEKLRGTVQNDMLKEFISRRTYRLGVEPSLRLVTDTFDYCERQLPEWNPISVSGYHMREAGCNAVQEVAFTLANAIAYFEAAQRSGVDLGYLARRISFFWNAHNHLLEEVAKFRAARRLWATLVRERFKLHDPSCARMRFHAQTAGSTLTAREPENNAVRVTIQALAAVLGGTQSLHTNSVDEALGLPSQTAARTALRTQQVIAHESGITDTADPLGGAPAIEALTDAIADGARDIIAEIDAGGGAVRAVERGYQKSIIEEEAYLHQKRIETGETTVVGVNRFRADDAGELGVEPQTVDPALEAERIRETRDRKSRRNDAEVARLREELRRHIEDGNNAVDGFVNATEGGLTLGEMTRVLVEIFGEHSE